MKKMLLGLFVVMMAVQGCENQTLKATLLIEPRTRQGTVWKKGRSLMSLSDDALKKPLRIIYKAPFGSIAGVLVRDDKVDIMEKKER